MTEKGGTRPVEARGVSNPSPSLYEDRRRTGVSPRRIFSVQIVSPSVELGDLVGSGAQSCNSC